MEMILKFIERLNTSTTTSASYFHLLSAWLCYFMYR